MSVCYGHVIKIKLSFELKRKGKREERPNSGVMYVCTYLIVGRLNFSLPSQNFQHSNNPFTFLLTNKDKIDKTDGNI
jgi:hypothetical protein